MFEEDKILTRIIQDIAGNMFLIFYKIDNKTGEEITIGIKSI